MKAKVEIYLEQGKINFLSGFILYNALCTIIH